MVMPNDPLSKPTSNGSGGTRNNPEDRREAVIALYEAGKATSEIARITGLTLSRVNQILKPERSAHIKKAGTDGIRLERVSELELVREHLFASLFPTNEDGQPLPPNKEAMAAYLRVVSLQGTLMGTSAAGPIYGPGALPKAAKDQMAIRAYQLGGYKKTDE